MRDYRSPENSRPFKTDSGSDTQAEDGDYRDRRMQKCKESCAADNCEHWTGDSAQPLKHKTAEDEFFYRRRHEDEAYPSPPGMSQNYRQ